MTDDKSRKWFELSKNSKFMALVTDLSELEVDKNMMLDFNET